MSKTLKATLWSIQDRVGVQIISFIIGVVLARILSPDDYGIVGLSAIFMAFSSIFMECGFTNALIRKLDRTDADFSTAFFLNLIMGIIIYVIIWIIAPYAAVYFDSQELSIVLRIIGLTIILDALCIVQNAIFMIDLNIKILTIINFIGLIPSGVIAIYLANKGYGVYALAVQFVSNNLIRTILLWLKSNWKPTFNVSKQSAYYLWNFSSKLIAANILGTFFNKIYSFIIGRYLGKTELGYYSKAESLSTQPDSIISGVILKVVVPIFSQYQEDKSLMLDKYRYCCQLIMLIVSYIVCILITIAEPLILILWGEKWEPTILIFQLLIFSAVFSPISTLNLQLLALLNHTEYTLKLEYIKKPLYVVFIIIGVQYSMMGLLISHIVISITAFIINMKASYKYLKYSFFLQFKDSMKYIIILLISASSIYITKHIDNIYASLFFGFFISSVLYFSTLLILRDQIIFDFLKKIKISNRS